MTAVRYTVAGQPVAKARPRRVTLRNGHRVTYTPRETLAGEMAIGWGFRAAAPKWRPRPGVDYELDVLFCLARKPGGTPDLDNLLKTVLDGLNRVAWPDDRQVVKVTARLIRRDPKPRTVIEVRQMSPERATTVDRATG